MQEFAHSSHGRTTATPNTFKLLQCQSLFPQLASPKVGFILKHSIKIFCSIFQGISFMLMPSNSSLPAFQEILLFLSRNFSNDFQQCSCCFLRIFYNWVSEISPVLSRNFSIAFLCPQLSKIIFSALSSRNLPRASRSSSIAL